MPVTLTVKQVPDSLVEQLRKRAKRHHRSLQGELMVIIEEAVGDDKAMPEVAEPRHAPSVWDSPIVQELLEQPAGSPIDLSGLSREELAQLAREARGMLTDRPDIRDSVAYVRKLREWRDIPTA